MSNTRTRQHMGICQRIPRALVSFSPFSFVQTIF
jgi:hypothetical protein